MRIEKELSGIKKNISLKNYTTFKIGGKAKYFFVAKNKKDIIKAVLAAKKYNLPFFILGGGSNILVADEGFKGLVIKFQISNFKLQIDKFNVGAGVPLAKLVSEATKNNLSGLEWAIGIPGTIGGAISGNAGAFGKSMKNVVKEVEVLNAKNLKTEKLKNRDCKFKYRDSIFKKNRNLIILSAKIQLKRGNKKEIEKKIKEYLDYRKKTQPLKFPSAGSIFKNPSPAKISKKFRRARGFSAGELGEEDKSSSSATELPKEVKARKRMKFSCDFAAARLIEKCRLKGKMFGKAKISEKHANFILNLGGAKAKDVKKLINLIKKKVKEKFKITLEEEITILS